MVVGTVVLTCRDQGVRQGQPQVPVLGPVLQLVLEQVDALASRADAHQGEPQATQKNMGGARRERGKEVAARVKEDGGRTRRNE